VAGWGPPTEDRPVRPDPVAAITGATGALGREAAARFAADGWRVGLLGTDQGRLTALAGDLELAQGSWAAGVGDLREAAAATAALGAVGEALGPVDALLHAVGGYAGGSTLVEVDATTLDDMVGQHVWSTFHAIRAVVPGMIDRGWGRVIAVVPVITAAPVAKQAAYTAAKAAQEALLRSLARELAGSGVTANIIAVKAIDAKGVRDREPSPKTAAWSTPAEIVDAMRWLCSDEAAAVNGQRIALDGR
jgi:3-oxoacyl-[acyl-carrier protein] reductase